MKQNKTIYEQIHWAQQIHTNWHLRTHCVDVVLNTETMSKSYDSYTFLEQMIRWCYTVFQASHLPKCSNCITIILLLYCSCISTIDVSKTLMVWPNVIKTLLGFFFSLSLFWSDFYCSIFWNKIEMSIFLCIKIHSLHHVK